jgi:hypothetical protein
MRYLIIALIFCSCNPLRHYLKVQNDPFRNEAERSIIARVSLQEFPPLKDTPTTTVIYDSTAWKELNEQYHILVDDYVRHIEADTPILIDAFHIWDSHSIDSFNNIARAYAIKSLAETVKKLKATKPATITKTIVKEVPTRRGEVENQLQNEINNCRRENSELSYQAKTATDKQKKTGTTNIWLWVVTGLLTIGHIARTKKLFT